MNVKLSFPISYRVSSAPPEQEALLRRVVGTALPGALSWPTSPTYCQDGANTASRTVPEAVAEGLNSTSGVQVLRMSGSISSRTPDYDPKGGMTMRLPRLAIRRFWKKKRRIGVYLSRV